MAFSGWFFTALLAFLAVLLYDPPMPHIGSHDRVLPLEAAVEGRTTLWIPSEGLKLHSWFYKPHEVQNPPLIILGHGFGAQKDFKIPDYIDKFVKAGFACLTFDYRYWGGSEGEPRQLISVPALLEDWKNVITFALSNLKEVNTTKIGLWGSSFAGGHVVVQAATHPQKDRIGAIVSQVPFSDGVQSAIAMAQTNGLYWFSRLGFYALKDLIRSWFNLERLYVPLLGRTPEDKGLPSILCVPGAWDGYFGIIPGGDNGKPEEKQGWENRVPASIALSFPFYRPKTYSSDVQAPALLVTADGDNMCPEKGAIEMVDNIKNGEKLQKKGDHFSAYLSLFDEISAQELEFFEKHLKSKS